MFEVTNTAQGGVNIYSLPAFLSVFFLPLRALARILFRADFAFLSLNLNRSGQK